MYYTVTYIDYNGDESVSEFDTRVAAERFVAVCDEVGVECGWPVIVRKA